MTKINTGVCMLTVFLSLTFIASCKKITNESEKKVNKIPESIQQRLSEEGIQTLFNINQKAKAFPSDENGDPITTSVNSVNKLTGECFDEDGLPLDFDFLSLQSVARQYVCGSGYKITVTWAVISPFTLTSTGSAGRFRIRNAGGSTIYPTGSPTYVNVIPVVITSLPTNPLYPSSYAYEVSYTSNWIPQTDFDAGVELQNFAILNTECGYKTISPLSTYVIYIGTIETQPCDRLDKVYIDFNSHLIAGCDAFANCYVTGYTHPNRHEVQYRVSGTGTWTTISFASNPYINYFDIWSPSLPSGTLDFRYRNQMASPACNGPWSNIETYVW